MGEGGKMKKLNRAILAAFVLLLFVSPAFAAYNSWGIPDSSEIRKGLVERWFEADLETVRMNLPEIYDNNAGEKFQVRLEEADSTYMIYVAPCAVINVNVYSNKGVTKEQQEVYPGDAPGSWVLVRDKKTNAPIRIRWYFTVNSDVYVQFTPYGKTAFADLVIYGNYASKGASTGVSFSELYRASFEDILSMTKISLPWKYVTVDGDKYDGVLQMVGMIQKNLGRVMYVPNAMYDEDGNLVQITNGKPFSSDSIDSSKLEDICRILIADFLQDRRKDFKVLREHVLFDIFAHQIAEYASEILMSGIRKEASGIREHSREGREVCLS